MKVWLVFIILKVVELGAIVFVPYWLGLGYNKVLNFEEDHKPILWLIGAVITFVVFVNCLLLFMIITELCPWFINLNMEWARAIVS